jgi:hypothetical protein
MGTKISFGETDTALTNKAESAAMTRVLETDRTEMLRVTF